MQNNLYNLHGVILHLLNLMLGVLDTLATPFLLLPRVGIPIFQFILLRIVVQVGEQLLTASNQALKGKRLIDSGQFLFQLLHAALACRVFVDQRLSGIYQPYRLFLDLPLQKLNLPAKLLYQLQFLHHLYRLAHVPAHLHKWSLQQSVSQEADILDGEHFDGMISVFVLACGAEYGKGIGAVPIHADIAISCHFSPYFLDLIMLFANYKRHEDNLYLQCSDSSPMFATSNNQHTGYKIIIFVTKPTRMKPDENYETADLNSIIKSRQSHTPKSNEDRQGQPKQPSEQQYQTLKSQYTTNYISTQHSQQKNQRTYRQEINIIRDEDNIGEFTAYCIVVKQSSLGIYNNERLIVFNSHKKTLSYYSQVPLLPITNPKTLPTPKETISVNTAKKFTYLPAKNGIGQVLISWIGEGTRKEWRLTMSSRRVAKEFGIIIEQVKNNEHLIKKTAESVKKMESPRSENKVNKKQTPFLAQLKKLEEQQRKNSNQSINPARRISRQEEIVNNGSEVNFTNIPINHKSPKQLKVQTAPEENIAPIISEKVTDSADQQFIKNKQLEIVPPQKSQQTIKIQRQENSNNNNELTPTQKLQDEAIQQKPKNEIVQQRPNDKEIKMQEIINNAQIQHTSYLLAIRSPNSQTKRFAQLQNILNNRNNKRSSLNSHDGNRLSQKKALVKKADKPNSQLLLDQSRKEENRESQQVTTPRRHSKYEDKYNSFRTSLLQQRRQQNTGPTRAQPKRQSGKSKSSVDEAVKVENWLSKWMLAGSKEELAVIYNSFAMECQARVRKLAGSSENWHLLHKAGQQFNFQQADITFQYFIFRQNSSSEALFKKEKDFMLKMANWSYLLQFILQDSKMKYRVPLACVVAYKGLKVFCRAAFHHTKFICSLVEDISSYVHSLRKLEEKCKISLHRCELYEVVLKDEKFIYFNQLDSLPKIKEREQLVDSNYINLFISEGVIRNQLDLVEITRHIEQKIINKFLERLNASHLLSTIEFDELLDIYGLNHTFMGELYARSKSNNLEQSYAYICSQLASLALAECVRLRIHKCLLNEHKDDTESIVFSVIQLFLQGNLMLMQQITQRAKLNIHQPVQFPKNMISQYVISSTLIQLAIRCDFRNKLPFEQLQNLTLDIWQSITFSPQFVHLYIVSKINSYNYRSFINSSLLEQTVFKKRVDLPEGLTKEKILAQINPFQKQTYTSSAQFKLLPELLKSRLNFYLSHFSPPNNRNLGLSFDLQHSQLYFNLYQHSTAYIPTHQSFAQDLIGIKWLIKRSKYEQADCKLIQQRQRVWIWGRHHPQVLMEIHDLQSLYALKRNQFVVAAERSLISLKLAIHYFGNKLERSWQLIWEKAFFAAGVNYQSNRFDQAASLYQICKSLNQRIKGEQLSLDEINEQFLEAYNKQTVIYLAQGRIDDCIDLIQANLETLKEWKSFFSKKPKASLLIKVDSELYQSYRLLLRCYEIKQNYVDYGSVLSDVLYSYFQNDWNPLYLNNPKLKLSDSTKHRLSDLIKYTWMYICKNIDHINLQLLQLQKPQIKQKIIYQNLENIRQQNKEFYRYTTQELFKYIVELVIIRTEKQVQRYKTAGKSSIISMIIQTLSQLSSNTKGHIRCRLYDQKSKQNKLLLLESVTHLTGYEFCMGVLQECFHNYSYHF